MVILSSISEPSVQPSPRTSEPPWPFPKTSRQIDLAEAAAEVKSRVQDRQGIEAPLSFSIQVPDFIVRLRLILVRLAQARLLPIQICQWVPKVFARDIEIVLNFPSNTTFVFLS